MEHIVNFQSEKKLIFIGSYLHKYVGALIKKDPTCEGSSYRTMPIIGDDWQVVDKTYANFESDYGYSFYILGHEGDTIHVTHPALQSAIESASDLSYRSIEEIMCDAITYGVKFDNTGVESTVTLFVGTGYKQGSFTLQGSYHEAPDGNFDTFRGHQYPMPTLEFTFCKSSLQNLQERIASDLYWYSYFFQDPNLRLSIRCRFDDKTLTAKQHDQLKEVETYVNNHLSGKDME